MLPRHQWGLSLLEFTLALLIVAVLTLMAFERIAAVQADMERAQVRHTVASMRSALALQFADLAVNGRIGHAESHHGGNALALLSPLPTGYRGERHSAASPDVAPGSWYYATEPGLVAYRPRYPDAFEPAVDDDAALYWRTLASGDKSRREGYDAYARGGGVALVPATARGLPLPVENKQQR